ncbi:hypothetical protein LCGC14_0643640, partial [marine sediment metagenome]
MKRRSVPAKRYRRADRLDCPVSYTVHGHSVTMSGNGRLCTGGVHRVNTPTRQPNARGAGCIPERWVA